MNEDALTGVDGEWSATARAVLVINISILVLTRIYSHSIICSISATENATRSRPAKIIFVPFGKTSGRPWTGRGSSLFWRVASRAILPLACSLPVINRQDGLPRPGGRKNSRRLALPTGLVDWRHPLLPLRCRDLEGAGANYHGTIVGPDGRVGQRNDV